VTDGEVGPRLETERLIMRRWQPSDLEPYAALNVDPEVVRHLGPPKTRAESDAMVERFERSFADNGYGPWALEVRETGRFIGFTGLIRHTFEAHFTPAVEVGWRLERAAWGHGYVTEAAREALAYAFITLGLDELVSMTAVGNTRSQAVMTRLGMTRDPADDFAHPAIPPDDPLSAHVLYRLGRERWQRPLAHAT
jgi:RimJ/RimL family protein N-acetyltransferase